MGFSPSIFLFPQSTVSSNLPKVTKFTTPNFFTRISIFSLLRHCFIVYWYFQIGTTHHQDSSLCIYIYIFFLFCFVSLCCVLWSYALHNNSFETYWVPFKCHSLYLIMNYSGTNSGVTKMLSSSILCHGNNSCITIKALFSPQRKNLIC